jgi:5-formyltetrahydrofolate cyclo-ligase
MLETRNKLKASEIEEKSKLIQEVVINSIEFPPAKVVGAYFAFGTEVKTDLIIKRSRMLDKKLVLPRIEKDKIRFYELTSSRFLIRSRFGIMEPLPHKPECMIDLLIVPGIAFDRKGYRLGYGKGYYDRLLSSKKTFSIGLAFSFQLLDNLPHDRYDKRLNAIAIEDGIHYA